MGGILAGLISDYSGMQAFTCGAMLVYSVPAVCARNLRNFLNFAHRCPDRTLILEFYWVLQLYLYYLYGGNCLPLNIGLLLLTGALVNGPYALITTAVSAKLGLDPTLSENTKALSTVTAIIDGTGSVGKCLSHHGDLYLPESGVLCQGFLMLILHLFFSDR